MPIHPKKPRKNIPNLHPEGFSPADPHLWAQAGNGLDQLQASSLALYGLTWTSMAWGRSGETGETQCRLGLVPTCLNH